MILEKRIKDYLDKNQGSNFKDISENIEAGTAQIYTALDGLVAKHEITKTKSDGEPFKFFNTKE